MGGIIMRRVLQCILSVGVMLIALCGCSNKSLLDPKDPVTLTMWHNYGGDMQATMDILIDEFNSTIGKEQGIVINVTTISSSAELNKSLDMIANGDPGAPEMPDIFTGYPKEAIKFQEKGMLVDLDDYFTKEELELYVESFVEEGRIADGGLYVFPIAKSTEVLYVNQTLFDRFVTATGADPALLETFEGIAQLSLMYYNYSGGKQFYAADSWFNFSEVGMAQLNDSIFDGEALSLEGENYEYIFNTIYTPAVEGGVIIYDGYSSDLSKTGDLVCSTGSSAGILFYGDTITYNDGTVENVEYNILSYPTFENGSNVALQRGGGLMVSKSDEKSEYAASVFVKWITASTQNMKFIEKTGYLPVTKKAFEEDMIDHLENLEDVRIKKMLTSVLAMYEEYSFFTAPNYSSFDDDSDEYEEHFKSVLSDARYEYLAGKEVSFADVLSNMRRK
ncbi:MAG: extracellular solute-binding protein [Erysipelotrichaceae bacterium]|nr:extracellular solute-binding protein [Erysipelotrichaceae bacterium]